MPVRTCRSLAAVCAALLIPLLPAPTAAQNQTSSVARAALIHFEIPAGRWRRPWLISSVRAA